MKKIVLFIISITLGSIAAIAQPNKNFNGTIVYSINIDSKELPKEALMMFDKAEAKTYIKGDKRRIDLDMSIQSVTSLIDTKANTAVTLMDFMGQKYLIRSTSEDIKKEEAEMPDYKINYTNETKDVAGYKCEKVEVTTTIGGKEEMMNVFVTDEIPYTDVKNTYKGLKGFPLEYAMRQSGIKITFTAKSVAKESISDEIFDIPKETYKEFTMDEFKKEMMKMSGQ